MEWLGMEEDDFGLTRMIFLRPDPFSKKEPRKEERKKRGLP
jgi:hypothetical protein